MIDLTFGTALAYNYRRLSDEFSIVFNMHEVAGEPGSFRFTACAYRMATGAFDSIYHDEVIDVYNVRDVRVILMRLFAAADRCVCSAFEAFDVCYNLTDTTASVWHPSRHVGRSMLAIAYERHGVDCYPLTADEVKQLAANDVNMMGADYYYSVAIRNLSQDGRTQFQRFEDERAARDYAKTLAGMFDANGTLFDIDVYYIDIDHKTWLTGYCNVPEN